MTLDEKKAIRKHIMQLVIQSEVWDQLTNEEKRYVRYGAGQIPEKAPKHRHRVADQRHQEAHRRHDRGRNPEHRELVRPRPKDQRAPDPRESRPAQPVDIDTLRTAWDSRKH